MIPADNLILNVLVMVVSFAILAKSADYLVDGAVGLAVKLTIPKMLIGIVLVGFGTTMPEFIVSIMSAVKGKPELALGNALGSIVADNNLALALGILVAPTVIAVQRGLLLTAGFFLLVSGVVSFALAYTGVISRMAGIVHLVLLGIYVISLIVSEKRRRTKKNQVLMHVAKGEISEHLKPGSTGMQFLRCGIGLAGVLLGSRLLVDAAINMAVMLNVPEVIIGLTLVAIGTSLPEVATCIAASRKGHGDLAIGDILGADILNLLWIVGAAATTRPITVAQNMIFFAYPAMLISVLVMLILAVLSFRLQKWKGIVLLAGYGLYLAVLLLT